MAVAELVPAQVRTGTITHICMTCGKSFASESGLFGHKRACKGSVARARIDPARPSSFLRNEAPSRGGASGTLRHPEQPASSQPQARLRVGSGGPGSGGWVAESQPSVSWVPSQAEWDAMLAEATTPLHNRIDVLQADLAPLKVVPEQLMMLSNRLDGLAMQPPSSPDASGMAAWFDRQSGLIQLLLVGGAVVAVIVLARSLFSDDTTRRQVKTKIAGAVAGGVAARCIKSICG